MGWKVTDQKETVSRVPGSDRFVDVVQVSYVTDSGIAGSVDVPTTDYNGPGGVDKVKAMIDAAVSQREAVKALTSES